MQSDLFDAVEAERLKEEGIARAVEWTQKDVLAYAQSAAYLHAERFGTVTVDDVYQRLIMWKYDPSLLGNAAGSIFRGKSWEFTGEWRKSTRTTNHGRYIRVWRLKA